MSNKTDMVVKLVLVFFVSLLSFSIGTYVGRKYSDNQHKMAQLEPSSAQETHREVASESSEAAPAAKGKESLTDEEIAKLAEEFVADDTAHENSPAEAAAHGATHGEAAAPAAHSEKVAKTESHSAKPAHGETAPEVAKSDAHKEKATSTADAPMKVAQQIAEGHTPPIEKAPVKKVPKEYDPARIPSSIPKDVAQYSVGKFTVQIASFATQNEADLRSKELQDKGYKAFIIPAQIKGKSWFRVSVGLFATEKEAKDYRSEFMTKAKVENAIVQKISK